VRNKFSSTFKEREKEGYVAPREYDKKEERKGRTHLSDR
jgi:hypothetical protein